jgi:inhibitor of cysteine peptidase
MRAYTLVLVVTFLAAGMLAACGGETKPVVYTEADSGSTIEVATGDSITVCLRENPSTGYAWREEHSAGLELLSDRFLAASPSPSPGMVGVPGTREFVFKAGTAGAQSVSAIYARPWEEDATGREAFSLTIDVR